MAENNPFKEALGDTSETFNPFAAKDANLTREQQLRTVAELNLVEPSVLRKSPKIAELTVHDLNDLASEFSGVPTRNERVAELSLEDIQDIEGVFFDFKVAAGRDLARSGIDGLKSVDVSCCCCTPCCCCAATDTSETDAKVYA